MVTFHTKVLTPSDAADSCVFYDEKQSATLSADGLFTINVGAGSVHGAALFTDLESGIVNSGQFAFAGSQCTSGNPYPYTPAKTATRQVQISFIDPISNLEESLPTITLNPTGYAMDAGSVGGVSYTNILRIDNSGSPPANTISSSDFTKLVALIAGTSSQYAKQAASGNAVIPGHTGAFSSSPQAGEIWFDTSDQTLKYATNSSGGVAALGTAAASSVSSVSGAAGAGIVASPTTGAVVLSLAAITPTAPTGSYGGSGKSASITVDQYGRVTAASEISTGAVPASGSLGNYLKYTAGGWASAPIEVTDLKKTGDASTNLFTDTMCPANKSLSLDSGTGTFKCQAIASLSTAAFDTATANAVNAAANATSANTASAIVARDGSGNFAASNATLSSAILKDTGSNSITVKAPATSASYNFTLPNSAGSNNQVLTTDGSGNLSWGTPAPGGVVTASAPLVVTSGNIAINPANASQPGALSAADWNTFNSKQGALGFTPVNKAGDSMAGPLTLPTNGLIVGTNQLVVNGNKVGIGTATSLTTLDVAGNIKIGASAETCDVSHAGMMHYNAPNLEYCDGGTSWKPLGVAGAGISSINSDTSSAHIFSADTAGSSLSYTNSSGSHVLHIPMASATSGSAGGLISHDDYANLLPGTLAAAKILVGNGAAPSVAAPVSVSGDLTMNSSGFFTLAKVRGTDVSATSPSSTGQTLRYLTGTGYVPNYIFLSDVKSSASGNANALTPACSSSQTVYWNSGTDTLACQNIGIAGSQIAAGSINPATAFTPTDLVPNANLPASATYWTSATGGINFAGGKVGIGSASPAYKLDVVDGAIRINNTAGTDADLRFSNNASTAGKITYSSQELQFTTAGSQKMVIQGGGNVGIGTATPNSTLDVNGTLRLEGSSGTYSALKSPTTAGNVTWTLPAADGASGQILKTDGAGNLSFAAPTATGVTQVLTGTGLTGGPINSTGTVSLAAIANNTLLANTSGSSAAPVSTTPSALLDTINSTQGSLLYRNGSSWAALPAATSGQFLQTQGSSANPQWATAVTSVGLSLPSIFTVTASPVTSSGTLTASLASQSGGLVFASPPGGGVPIFRAIASTDLPASATYWATAGSGINYAGGGNVGIGSATPAVALDISSRTDAVGLPRGTTAQQPSSPTAGWIRFNSTTNLVEYFNGSLWASVGNSVDPAGMVASFPMASCPTGWLEANGSAVSRTTYASLYAVIGVLYGSGDGSTTFTLPDYRGYFLRGWSHASSNDPDAASRTARGDGTPGDAIGTKQGDQLTSHSHTGTNAPLNQSYGVTSGTAAYVTAYSGGTSVNNALPTGSSGGNETRPKNINVIYCVSTATAASTTVGSTGSGTANYLSKWTSTTGLANSLIYDSGAGVGIGTSTVTSPLTVAGTIETTSGGIKFPDGSVQITAVPRSAAVIISATTSCVITSQIPASWVSSLSYLQQGNCTVNFAAGFFTSPPICTATNTSGSGNSNWAKVEAIPTTSGVRVQMGKTTDGSLASGSIAITCIGQ